jgi:hypothetical protein
MLIYSYKQIHVQLKRNTMEMRDLPLHVHMVFMI